MSDIDQTALLAYVRKQMQVDWYGLHGIKHWSRVLVNGLMIARKEHAREDVVTLFALLHDHRRMSEGIDPHHGERAAESAHALRNRFFTIDDAGMELLTVAMTYHSRGFTDDAHITIRACWDADRLDLGRVGIRPDPDYLCTETACDSRVIEAAYARSIK